METKTMNGTTARLCAAVLAVIGMAVACTSTQNAKAPENWDGLERRQVKGIDAVYVRPNVQFPPYKSVMLDPVQVSFSKSWDPNDTREVSRHLDAADLQKIKDELARLFRESFAEELGKGGYPLVEAPADDTMRIEAAIVDLYINAPDTMTAGRSRTYTTEAGAMTLAMELRDGPTGQVLARVVDRRTAETAGGYMQWTNSVTNRADARRLLDEWARRLRGALDKLNGRAST